MSRGLGTLQRKLIDISTATQTIWEAAPDGIKVVVADIVEKSACGITTVRKDGSTWRKTGDPWCSAEATVRSQAELLELKRNFRAVDVERRRQPDETLTACWSMHHIRATLWPDLWRKGDNREDLSHPRFPYASMLQIPPDIKKGRNAAQAGLSRAIKSMEDRGLVISAGYTTSKEACTIWRTHGGTIFGNSDWHNILLVLDPLLTKAQSA
jgi:hypothetical protein